MADWSKLYDQDLLVDIVVGLVLHLDPNRLAQEGATCTDPPGVRVEGQHFFLCVEISSGSSKWIPLFTARNAKRNQLAADGRQGHQKWVGGTFHYHPAQIWTATPTAIAIAAARAHDKSRRGVRNTIAVQYVPRV